MEGRVRGFYNGNSLGLVKIFNIERKGGGDAETELG